MLRTTTIAAHASAVLCIATPATAASANFQTHPATNEPILALLLIGTGLAVNLFILWLFWRVFRWLVRKAMR